MPHPPVTAPSNTLTVTSGYAFNCGPEATPPILPSLLLIPTVSPLLGVTYVPLHLTTPHPSMPASFLRTLVNSLHWAAMYCCSALLSNCVHPLEGLNLDTKFLRVLLSSFAQADLLERHTRLKHRLINASSPLPLRPGTCPSPLARRPPDISLKTHSVLCTSLPPRCGLSDGRIPSDDTPRVLLMPHPPATAPSTL